MSDGINVVSVEEGCKALVKEIKKCIKGGKVLLFQREDRAGKDVAAALTVEGFSVVKREVKDGFIMNRTFDREELDFVAAAVGVGGLAEMEAAKDYSAYGKVPTFLYPTDLTGLVAEKADAEFIAVSRRVTVRADEFTVVADRALSECEIGVRAGIGYLLSRLAEVTDGAYADLILHKKDPALALVTVKDVGAFWEQTAALPLPERIVSTTLRLGSEIREKKLSVVKSATDLAFLTARRQGGRYDDYLFSSAYALFDLYRYYLSDFPLECALPPDRAENAARIEKACGLSASAHLKECVGYADGYNERMRVTGEYREDFLRTVNALPLAALCRAYRRAETACEEKTLSSERLLDLLSLTGEAVSGYALVKHIKLTGLMEPLLISA